MSAAAVYPPEEIRAVRREAELYGLDAPLSFWLAPDEEVQQVYNGCGPDRWPGWLRAVATKIVHHFRAAVAVHDWEYQHSDRTRPGFEAANARFLHNLRAIVDRLYSWWTEPRAKAEAHAVAQAMYYAVQWGGWDAWLD